MEEVIICVAPCPGDNQSERFPGKMDVPEEVLRSHNAGASVVHLHVRDEKGLQTTDTTLFKKHVEKIRSVTRLLIEGSTGGTPEHTLAQRCVSLTVPGIEMGSLNMGSVNMAGGVYQNPMSEIRYYAAELMKNHIKPGMCIFDLSMVCNAERLKDEGLLAEPRIYNLVLDVPDALPFSKEILRFLVSQLPGDAIWFLTRHHARGRRGFQEALEMGGHVRVGYEDGPFLRNGERARSNAELVEEIAGAAREVGRKVVDPERAREILGIGR
jgi:3-keto-5-aminohexanoate cleavage enzyme